jgi:transposase
MKELLMKIINANAAGIDVGSRSHMVAVNQDVNRVREFGVYTADHEALIVYLKENRIGTVAMESTGSYWQTLFNALQKAGFEVLLVNARYIKNVKGKKTDVIDCMWIQKLHSLGLLQGSFLLSDHLLTLRTYYEHRQYLIEQTSKYINKMQKALRLMNIRLDVAISDVTGKSGRAILEGILNGERDAYKLALLVNTNLKKSKEEIAKSLHGQWRDDLVFELKSCLYLYDMYVQQIAECDKKMQTSLEQHFNSELIDVSALKKLRKTHSKHAPRFNVRHLALAHLGTDLFEIPGISYNTVLCILSHMGTDIHKFGSGKQFASWLRLVPNNKISGGKIISTHTPKGKNRLALAFRQAANSVGNQKNHPLTPFFTRIAYRKGRIAAITATARKLSVITWNMITKQENYIAHRYEVVTEQQKSRQLKNIRSKLLKLNLKEEELKELFIKTTGAN